MRRLRFICAMVVVLPILEVFSAAHAQFAELGPPPTFPEPPPPLSYAEPVEKGITVDTSNRADVAAFYNATYMDSEGVTADWDGDMTTCTPGTTSTDYEDATILRVNYFRAMAGLNADITADAAWIPKCQEASLMMIANEALSHTPPASWTCYTADGAQAAGKSNIALGAHGPGAIDAYIEDAGDNNEPIGHRRWILYPPQLAMGTGSVTAQSGTYYGANALLVTTGSWSTASQSTSWPPEGYVPYQVVYDRWSFSYPSADFSQATVAMERVGSTVALTVLNITNGFGDNTVVWEPQGVATFGLTNDETYAVTISDVLIGSAYQDFAYEVTIIDPGGAGEATPIGEGCVAAMTSARRPNASAHVRGDAAVLCVVAVGLVVAGQRKRAGGLRG